MLTWRGQGKRLSDISCPDCRAENLLKFWDPQDTSWRGHYYCPECDTLFQDVGGHLYGMVKTQEPYTDFDAFLKGLSRR